MMWRKQKPPEKDPWSIGNILVKIIGLDKSKLAEAVKFKAKHEDILLGEACIRLGFVSRIELETAIFHQKAIRAGGAHSLSDAAVRQSTELGEQIDELVLTQTALANKLDE